jgi:hypothetical protein
MASTGRSDMHESCQTARGSQRVVSVYHCLSMVKVDKEDYIRVSSIFDADDKCFQRVGGLPLGDLSS